MKKLLLGLGTVSLAILPVAAMVSCSTTTPQTSPTLETEAAKLNTSLRAKYFTMTTSQAIATILSDQSESHDGLKSLVGEDNLPTLADGFTFVVTSAMVNSKINTTIDVKITVIEKDEYIDDNTMYTTLQITKLTSVPASLDTESSKFILNLNSLDENITTTEAIAKFRGDANVKLETLKSLVGEDNLPTLADGFTFEVKLVALNRVTNTTIDVEITVTETNGIVGSNKKDAILSITNLAGIPTLESETKKMNIALKAIDLTNNTNTLVEEFNNSSNNETAKLSILQNLVGAENIPVLAEDFWFGVKSASINATTPTTLDINITVRTGWFWFQNTVLQVTDVPLPTIDSETAKLNISKATKTPTTIITAAIDSINNATDAPTKLAAFKVLVDAPTPSTGFSFEVMAAAALGTTNMTVTITVKQDGTEITKIATFTITGLKAAPTLAAEAAKYDISLAALTAEATKTAAEAAATITGDAATKLAALKTLVGENVPTVSMGFTFEVTSAVIGTNNTTVEVIITVTETAGSKTATGKMTITGFTAPTTP